MRKTSLMAVAFAVAAMAVLLTAGSAAAADKNRDRIPDKWEKKNHLSLKVNQAPKDQDRDGLNNAGEYQDQTDPHDSDTDDDGVSDSADDDNHDGEATEGPPLNGDGLPGGNDQAGAVASYVEGVLTIEMFTGGTISANVTPDTHFRCTEGPGDDPVEPRSEEPAPGDEHPGTEPGDEPGGTEPGDEPGDTEPGDEPGGEEPGDDDGDDNSEGETPCGVADLVPGTLVHEANVQDGKFVLLVLVK
jgi:hypothetical protein